MSGRGCIDLELSPTALARMIVERGTGRLKLYRNGAPVQPSPHVNLFQRLDVRHARQMVLWLRFYINQDVLCNNLPLCYSSTQT